jgi:hypothetical protein
VPVALAVKDVLLGVHIEFTPDTCAAVGAAVFEPTTALAFAVQPFASITVTE